MAAMAENRMNLAALQQRDPYITGIVDTASQVALYSFNAQTNEWEKTEVEGTLFVYTRSASPINGFMILNRLGLNDMIEPINKNLEFQLQDPFLLYRNGHASICGIWFYDKDECARIGQLMNSLVQIAIDSQDQQNSTLSQSRRERRASESEVKLDQRPQSSGATGADEAGAGVPVGGVNGMVIGAGVPGVNINIMQMLTKAQDEYEQVNPGAKGVPGKRSAPKPMIDNPNAAATKSTNIIKPLALKPAGNHGDGEEREPDTPTSTHINLDALFKQAGVAVADKQPQSSEYYVQGLRKQPHSAAIQPTNQMPPLLQRLMSQPGSFLEDIERNQRGEILRDEMPKPAGAEAPATHLTNGAAVPKLASPPKTVQAVWNDPEPDSPNTALRRTLNLLPSSSSSPSQLFVLDGSSNKRFAAGQVNSGNKNEGGDNSKRISPGFPGLRRNLSGCNSEMMMNHSGGGGGQFSSLETDNQQQQSFIHHQQNLTDALINSQKSHQGSSLFGGDGGGKVEQGRPGFFLQQQQLFQQNPPPQQNPSSISPSLMSGIHPLPSDVVQAQLRQLTISDHKVFSSDSKQQTPPMELTKSDAVSEWLSGTSPSLKSAGLVTPQALVGGGGVTPHSLVGGGGVSSAPRNLSNISVSSQVSASPHQASGSGSVLLTPMAFETSSRVTPPGSGSVQQSAHVQCLVDSDSASQKSTSPLSVDKSSKHLEHTEGINPLTREQLQQALIHMLKNDSGFVSSIHEAYVKSLQLSLRTERK